MQWIQDPVSEPGCILVLGMFDGVHRGHQALLMRGLELREELHARVAVCTFEPHPLCVFAPERAPKRLSTPEERRQLMESMDVDILCIHTFTKKLAETSPSDFLEYLTAIYQPVALICGYNFTFGHRGQGNGETLRTFCKARGIRCDIIDEVRIAGAAVSSSRIREELCHGDIRMVNRLLGHAYTLEGPVIHGQGIGRTLGCPTANIQVTEDKALPRFGAYVATLEHAGKIWKAMVNIGSHPTLPGNGLRIEAHVLNASLDLYDQHVVVSLMDFMRPEKQFDSLEALKAQLEQDKQNALAWFASR